MTQPPVSGPSPGGSVAAALGATLVRREPGLSVRSGAGRPFGPGQPRCPTLSAGGSVLVDEALSEGAGRELRPALGVELLEDVPEVELRGVLGDPQPACDLLVPQPRCHQLEDLELALRESVRPGRD